MKEDVNAIEKTIFQSCVNDPLLIGNPNYNYKMEAPPAAYEVLENNVIKCNICKRYCLIPPGKSGFCLGRENIDGKQFVKAVGALRRLCPDTYCGQESINIGSFYCNFRCKFCFADAWRINGPNLPPVTKFTIPFFGSMGNKKLHIRVSPINIREICQLRNIEFVEWGSSEPTVNAEFVIDIAQELYKHGIKLILNTNGYSTPLVTKTFAKIAYVPIIGIKAFWDQEAYDRVVAPGRQKVDVGKILDTVVDFHDYGAKGRIILSVLADGAHANPKRGLEVFEELKRRLPPESVRDLNIWITPVVYSSPYVTVHRQTGSEDKTKPPNQWNVTHADVIGAVEFEMNLKRMGFKNAFTDYSSSYKETYGDYPQFWDEDMKGGLMEQVEKTERKFDMASYFMS